MDVHPNSTEIQSDMRVSLYTRMSSILTATGTRRSSDLDSQPRRTYLFPWETQFVHTAQTPPPPPPGQGGARSRRYQSLTHYLNRLKQDIINSRDSYIHTPLHARWGQKMPDGDPSPSLPQPSFPQGRPRQSDLHKQGGLAEIDTVLSLARSPCSPACMGSLKP